MPPSPSYRQAPRILGLDEGFFDVVKAARFPEQTLRFRNDRAARSVGLEGLDAEEWTRHFAAFEPLPENLVAPLALRYHGHQFGVYNPQLGDGRGFLFAQLKDDRGRLLDLGTKGSGTTPWSRGGDGRLTLQGGIREVLATEMLEALGVSTSKSFSLFETGERLMRGDEPSPTRSSVLVRLSHSHIRFGTFQRFAQLGDTERLKKLLDYTIQNYFPDLASAESKPAAFVAEVARRAARLVASYQIAGFVHGVLNTDNMNITGESFDYGPWRFLPSHDPTFTAAYFDESGLYAFGQQPRVFAWNLTRLADALRPLDPTVPFAPALRSFQPAFDEALGEFLIARLGLVSNGTAADGALVDAVFAFLEKSKASFEGFFFDWYGGLASEKRALEGPNAARYAGPAFDALRTLLEIFGPAHPERLSLPFFQRDAPCSLVIEEVRAIWAAIAERNDFGPFEERVAAIRAFGEAIAPSQRS